MKNEFFYRSEDGATQIHAIEWVPEVPVIGIIQILHGMAEYVDRYDAFAEYMAQQGFYVVGNDHLGHGQSVRSERYLGHLREYRGNKFVIRDIRTLQEGSIQKYPGLPYIMLGHSMGSFLLREYMTIYPDSLSAAIIMGTGEQTLMKLKLAQSLCKFIAHFKGWKHKSKMMDHLTLGNYNKKFEDVTGVDWLSANAENCHRYAADPLCGFSFTLGGYFQMFEGMKWILQDNHENRMQKNLPILLISGEEDPVGGFGKDVKAVFERYHGLGMTDVTIRLYEGDRHEILNEDNREEVYDDIVSWIYGKRENLTREPLAVDTFAEKEKTKKHPAKASAPEAEEAKNVKTPETEGESAETEKTPKTAQKAEKAGKKAKFSLSQLKGRAKDLMKTTDTDFDEDDDVIKEDAVPEVTKNLSLRAAAQMKELAAEYDEEPQKEEPDEMPEEGTEDVQEEPKGSGYMTLGDFIRSISSDPSLLRDEPEPNGIDELRADSVPEPEEEEPEDISVPEEDSLKEDKTPVSRKSVLEEVEAEEEEEKEPVIQKAVPLGNLGQAKAVPKETVKAETSEKPEKKEEPEKTKEPEEELTVPALEDQDGFEEIFFTIDDFEDAEDTGDYDEDEEDEDYDDSDEDYDDDSEDFAEEDFAEEELDEESFEEEVLGVEELMEEDFDEEDFNEEDFNEEDFDEDDYEEEYPELEDDFIDNVLEAIQDETTSDAAPEPTIDMKNLI